MIDPIKPFTPLQYVIGKEKFLGLEFAVNENVFIPRPETEILAHTAMDIIREIKGEKGEVRILDLCTGSGCIAISLAARLLSPASPDKINGLTKNAADCKIIASDISEKALSIAKENAVINGVADKVAFIKSDLFEKIEGGFDVIIANPPYIARHEFETLQKEVLKEPMLALDGGEDGLDFYRKIFAEAPRYLKNGSYCIMEIGFGQRKAVKEIIDRSKNFKLIDVMEDQYSIDRVILTKWIN